MEDCVFCKIINKEIPSAFVYEDENCVAFNDINPQAPIHIIVVPKKHVENVLEADGEMIKNIFKAINKIASEKNTDKSGFRVITNCGKDAGQTVNHYHMHLIPRYSVDEVSLWSPHENDPSVTEDLAEQVRKLL